MKDDLREELHTELLRAMLGRTTTQAIAAILPIIARERDAAIAAARPVIGEECAKVAEDDRHLWGAAGGVGNAVLLAEPSTIAAAIRSATR